MFRRVFSLDCIYAERDTNYLHLHLYHLRPALSQQLALSNACGNEQVKISRLQRTHLVTMSPCISNIPCFSLISFGNLSLSGQFPAEHFIRISFMALSLISDPCPPNLLSILGPSLYLGPYLRVFLLDPLSRWSTPWWQVPILSTKNSTSHARGGFGKALRPPCLSTILQS